MDATTYHHLFQTLLSQAKRELNKAEYLKLESSLSEIFPGVQRIYVGPKKCSKCKDWKDRGEFSSDKSRKDGLSRRCKMCDKVNYMQSQRRQNQAV